MALPVVAIIGRPNVGKSSLLNGLAGSKISIVDPTAGVTRDRVEVVVSNNDRFFELVDTGGYGIVDSDKLESHVENQIHQAIGRADLVLFVVDIRDGITPLDTRIAQLLRKTNLEVMLLANKADSASMFPKAGEFLRLGFGEAFCLSAANNLNKKLLMETIIERLDHLPNEIPEKEVMKIAIVGKRNAGKSTFINSVVGHERVIASEVPGTTRDAVDVRFEKDGKKYTIIDTAGVRKKSVMRKESIEFYSFNRATRSIRRANVVLFMIDATLPISQVDKKLADFITQEEKPCIFIINKWDLAKEHADTDDYAQYLTEVMPGLKHAPLAFTTATEGRNVSGVLDLAVELFKQATTQLATPVLNRAIEMIKAQRISVPKKRGGYPKIYYATQISTEPVTILLFVNNPDLFDNNYQRFIVNRMRELLPVSEVPIKLALMPRSANREE